MAQEQHSNLNSGSWGTRNKLALIGFLAIAAYFLWTEHKAHVVQFLPYALLLLCRSCTYFMANMEVMAGMIIRTIAEGSQDDTRIGIRLMVFGRYQFIDVYHLRL